MRGVEDEGRIGPVLCFRTTQTPTGIGHRKGWGSWVELGSLVMKVLYQGSENREDGHLGDVSEAESRPVPNICGFREGAKLRPPACGPIPFSPHPPRL